jgi:hypothetical protein
MDLRLSPGVAARADAKLLCNPRANMEIPMKSMTCRHRLKSERHPMYGIRYRRSGSNPGIPENSFKFKAL